MPSRHEGMILNPNEPGCLRRAEHALAAVMAKSASHSGTGKPETLTEHSRAARDAVRQVRDRIGLAGALAGYPRFWEWAQWAALLHDAGKIAAGFQRQLAPGGQPWGERHEILSLAYAGLLMAGRSAQDRAMIAAGVAFHHRCLDGRRGLSAAYPRQGKDWERAFGIDRAAPAGRRVQVPPAYHAALLEWLAAELGVPVPADAGDRKLWERAREQFSAVQDRWSGPVAETEGLIAVLLQGAVTLADHVASAHVTLETDPPVPFGYLGKAVAAPYPHQAAAAATDGHMIVIAPTGSGKTEAGLGWASRQLEAMAGTGQPRLVWLLPYRASIDAMRDRLARGLGRGPDGIGVLHATTAATLLGLITGDDGAPGARDARKARAMAGAMRLFRQRVRVATPHQLLRGALAGPKYSSVLLEQANSVFVLDEMHAYDPVTFGRICAAMSLWEKLGSRVAVVSATLAPPMVSLVRDSLSAPVTVHRAVPGTAPLRHRLVLDDEPLTAPRSLDRIRGWLAEGRSVLAVANTVAAAQRLYRELAPGTGDDQVLLLHSRFKYEDRRKIEERVMSRHPERSPADPAVRAGGLVVSTQVLEVSLCLDFDRGLSEAAPVEALAQRAGRVNRLGRHPGGPAEFRVHRAESPLPYEEGAVDAAMRALRDWDGRLLSEQAIGQWLERAYQTPWGLRWEATARDSRDGFAEAFLTFPEPFGDRGEFAAKLDEQFDTVEILLREDEDAYRERALGADGDPMLAAGLLIPVSWRQKARLRARFAEDLGVWVADAAYDSRLGLDLAAGRDGGTAPETIL
jgi:CRISPR-associated endonuclease/helicase Cas3